MELIFHNIGRLQPISRMVTITGFSNRVLKNLSQDPSLKDLLDHLVAALRDCLEPAASWKPDPITRSLAWCHLQAFHRLFGTEVPLERWERSWTASEDEPRVLAMTCDMSKAPPVVTPQHRSIQMAFINIQDLALEVPTRLISAVHYLCYLAVARYHGLHITDIGERLPAILAAGSEMSKRVQGYSLVPELRRVFEHCRTILSMNRKRREAPVRSGEVPGERAGPEAPVASPLGWSLPAGWTEKLMARESEVGSRVLDG